MSNTKRRSMTEGRLWDAILFFALPLAASSILQQLFNSADVAVVGRFAGSDALAAVGANGALINLVVNSFVGLSIGANVVISQFIGQERYHHVKRAVHSSIIMALFMGVVLLIVGELFAPLMLEVISTPDNILSAAIVYLRIYGLGIPFIMLYNFEAAILRSSGNTRRPLISLFVAGVINIILNIIFVVFFHMSVAGVALATAISNIVSSTDLFIYLLRADDMIRIEPKMLKPDFKIIKGICRIGIPASLQSAVFSVSNLILQTYVNSFGSAAIAGTTTALNFEYISYFLLSAFGQAAVTFNGQNYGAGHLDRCREVLKWCLIEGEIITVVISFVFLLFARPLCTIFTTDPEVIKIAITRMWVLLAFECFNATIEVFSGALRGLGHSAEPALMAIFGVCGIRILWVILAMPISRSYLTLVFCYPISWVVTTVGLIVIYLITIRQLHSQL